MIRSSYLKWFFSAFFLFLAACSGPSAADNELASFTENDVEVVVFMEQSELAATFTPLEDEWHLYAKDLPPGGVDGVGRPTRLEIVSGDIQPAGELTESIAPILSAGEDPSSPLMIYPAGPVTLQLPVARTGNTADPAQAELSITYMICHDELGCKPPVQDKRLTVTIPDMFWNPGQ